MVDVFSYLGAKSPNICTQNTLIN